MTKCTGEAGQPGSPGAETQRALYERNLRAALQATQQDGPTAFNGATVVRWSHADDVEGLTGVRYVRV